MALNMTLDMWLQSLRSAKLEGSLALGVSVLARGICSVQQLDGGSIVGHGSQVERHVSIDAPLFSR
eukprot:164486-Amphidinium_carterae.2